MILSQSSVKCCMLRSRQHLEILRSVVGLVLVYVMNFLIRQQEAPDGLFRYDSGPFDVATESSAWMTGHQHIDIAERCLHLATMPFVVMVKALVVIVDIFVPLPRPVSLMFNGLFTSTCAQWPRMLSQHVRAFVVADVLSPVFVHSLATSAQAKRAQFMCRAVFTPPAHLLRSLPLRFGLGLLLVGNVGERAAGERNTHPRGQRCALRLGDVLPHLFFVRGNAQLNQRGLGSHASIVMTNVMTSQLSFMVETLT